MSWCQAPSILWIAIYGEQFLSTENYRKRHSYSILTFKGELNKVSEFIRGQIVPGFYYFMQEDADLAPSYPYKNSFSGSFMSLSILNFILNDFSLTCLSFPPTVTSFLHHKYIIINYYITCLLLTIQLPWECQFYELGEFFINIIL